MAERGLRVVVIAEEAAGVQVLQGLMALPTPPEIVAVLTRSSAEGAERPVVSRSRRRSSGSTSGRRLRQVARPRHASSPRRGRSPHERPLALPDSSGGVAAPTIGSFNLHPGPLPEYAGLNVPSWAIYEGERSHGVTLHWMDEGIDTGPIVWQERFDDRLDDTGLALSGNVSGSACHWCSDWPRWPPTMHA